MTRLIVESQVDPDGVLRLSVPFGPADANLPVQVTIDALPHSTAESSQYVAWLNRVAGKWQGDFERMPQGELESRDPI